MVSPLAWDWLRVEQRVWISRFFHFLELIWLYTGLTVIIWLLLVLCRSDDGYVVEGRVKVEGEILIIVVAKELWLKVQQESSTFIAWVVNLLRSLSGVCTTAYCRRLGPSLSCIDFYLFDLYSQKEYISKHFVLLVLWMFSYLFCMCRFERKGSQQDSQHQSSFEWWPAGVIYTNWWGLCFVSSLIEFINLWTVQKERPTKKEVAKRVIDNYVIIIAII